MALFFSSSAFCGLFGGLLAFGILHMDGLGNLQGWQWLFLLEGFPSVVAGVVVWFVLPNGPSDCRWLNEEERIMATQRLRTDGHGNGNGNENENGDEKGVGKHVIRLSDIKATMKDWRVLGCAFVYFTILTAFYSVAFFLPALMSEFGFSSLEGNLMSAPVYFCAAVVMLVNAYHSDRQKERVWHVVVPGMLGVASWITLAAACAIRNFACQLVASFCVTSFTWSLISPMLAWLMSGLKGATSSAVGAALVVAIGNILSIVLSSVSRFLLSHIYGCSSRISR
jgi:MFS family permease